MTRAALPVRTREAFSVGDVTDVVDHLLAPVPADGLGEELRWGQVGGRAGDGEGGDGVGLAVASAGGGAFGEDDLGGVGEGQIGGRGQDLGGASFVAGRGRGLPGRG